MALIRAVLAKPDFGFDISDADGHVVRMDIPVSQGGGGTGVRPMQSLLAALCGCSGVDIVRILRKQRQQMSSLEMQVDGTRGTGGDLALWEHIALRVLIGGVVEPAKARRAVALSIDTYCSVAETLRRAGATITWHVEVNGVPVPDEA
jgi:putative redox protein